MLSTAKCIFDLPSQVKHACTIPKVQHSHVFPLLFRDLCGQLSAGSLVAVVLESWNHVFANSVLLVPSSFAEASWQL
jgi:hypothetical protein